MRKVVLILWWLLWELGSYFTEWDQVRCPVHISLKVEVSFTYFMLVHFRKATRYIVWHRFLIWQMLEKIYNSKLHIFHVSSFQKSNTIYCLAQVSHLTNAWENIQQDKFNLETNTSFQWGNNKNLWSGCFEIKRYGQDYTPMVRNSFWFSETMTSNIVRNLNIKFNGIRISLKFSNKCVSKCSPPIHTSVCFALHMLIVTFCDELHNNHLLFRHPPLVNSLHCN